MYIRTGPLAEPYGSAKFKNTWTYYESSSKLEVKEGKPLKALKKILPHGPYFSFQSQLHATILRKYLQTL